MTRFRKDSNELILSTGWQGALDGDIWMLDEPWFNAFEQLHPWGMDAAIDLFACDPALIRDPTVMRAFVLDLCDQIQMRRYGEPHLVHFGEDPRVSGYTLVQLIETSDITAHFIEQTNAACLNVFSCAAYPPYRTAALCQYWFRAQEVRLSLLFRGCNPSRRQAHIAP
jgi:S-adenosylmethionine/arginine decarboxylase-like enzyme